MVVEASYFSRFELQFDTKATYDRMFYRHASYLSHFTYMTCGIPIFSPHSILSIPFLISSVQEGHWEGWTLVGSGGGAPCLSSCSFWGSILPKLWYSYSRFSYYIYVDSNILYRIHSYDDYSRVYMATENFPIAGYSILYSG